MRDRQWLRETAKRRRRVFARCAAGLPVSLAEAVDLAYGRPSERRKLDALFPIESPISAHLLPAVRATDPISWRTRP